MILGTLGFYLSIIIIYLYKKIEPDCSEQSGSYLKILAYDQKKSTFSTPMEELLVSIFTF